MVSKRDVMFIGFGGLGLSVTGTDSVIDLPNVLSIQDGFGDDRLRAFIVEASGASSAIQMPSLTQIIDRNINRRSQLIASTGGTIQISSLTDARGIDFVIDGTGTVPIAQLESLIDSKLTLSGFDVALPNLEFADGTDLVLAGVNLSVPQIQTLRDGSISSTGGGGITAPLLSNIDGADLSVNDGVTLSLPGVKTYRHAASGSYVDRQWMSNWASANGCRRH